MKLGRKQYPQLISAPIDLIRAHAGDGEVLPAAIALAKAATEDGRPNAAMWLMAAAVEIIEPSETELFG